MSPPTDEKLATKPDQPREDRAMGNTGNQIDVALVATRDGNVITISGDGAANLPANSGAYHFKFTLTDNTGQNVQFSRLDAADDCSTCPPPSGENSQQITGMTIKPNASPPEASFTDNNSNNAANGPMNVSYQWNFTCNTPCTVTPYDPIITNGGKTGV
jgi:hypothetical protein